MRTALQSIGVLPRWLPSTNKKDQLDIAVASYEKLRDQAMQPAASWLTFERDLVVVDSEKRIRLLYLSQAVPER